MGPDVVANIVQFGRRDQKSAPASLLNEVQRIRSQLNNLEEQVSRASEGRICRTTVRSAIKARSSRADLFGQGLFADPAWDMLLQLYASEVEQVRISVMKLCLASGVPGTTGLRWIDKLQAEGLVRRLEDHLDGRRTWIQLTEAGLTKMDQYFEPLQSGQISV